MLCVYLHELLPNCTLGLRSIQTTCKGQARQGSLGNNGILRKIRESWLTRAGSVDIMKQTARNPLSCGIRFTRTSAGRATWIGGSIFGRENFFLVPRNTCRRIILELATMVVVSGTEANRNRRAWHGKTAGTRAKRAPRTRCRIRIHTGIVGCH